MNIEYKLLSSAIILFSVISPLTYANTKTCNTKDIIQKIEQRLDNVTDYQVTVTSVVNDQQPAEMLIASKRPDLLKATVKISDTDKLIIVYDKKYQWIEEANTVYQVDLSKAKRRTAERPFDTDYSLAGGLISGEDYIGTIKTLLSVYDLKASCRNNSITLKGNINIQKFTEYAKNRHIDAPLDEFVKQFANTLRTATFELNKKDYLINSYRLIGTDKLKVDFSHYDFAPLTAGQLSYKIPEGGKPIDITPGNTQSEPVPATEANLKTHND